MCIELVDVVVWDVRGLRREERVVRLVLIVTCFFSIWRWCDVVEKLTKRERRNTQVRQQREEGHIH